MDLVEALSANDHTLRNELAGLPDAALTRRPNEVGWSIKETLGHLCDVSYVLHRRLAKMIKLEEPDLDPYDAETLAAARNAQGRKIEDLLAEYSAQRAETVEMLANLVHWNWARTGRHPQLGRMSIRQQVELWLEHEAEHLQSIREAKAAS